MLTPQAYRLVLIISLAHALVHLFELALPSVEQEIALEFFPDKPADGKAFSGRLSNYWRLFWGLGALGAGWLVDRLGGRPMLAIYLIGCGLCSLIASFAGSISSLTFSMLSMGACASIYHPAGLALIANETDPVNRPRALGLHGILGSLGISIGPLIAFLALGSGLSWRGYFALLAIPAFLLGLVFVALSWQRQHPARRPTSSAAAAENAQAGQWIAFFFLTCLSFSQGFVYAAQMSFLPRYLSQTLPAISAPAGAARPLAAATTDRNGTDRNETDGTVTNGNATNNNVTDSTPDSGGLWSEHGKLLAAIALVIGCGGQFLAGRFARHDRLEWQIALISLANVPCLFWMAFATGWQRPVAAGLFALVHFMHQPIYNSLIPKYAPRRHRSLCFGLSIAIGLGCGSFGARFAGAFVDDRIVYSGLAGVACLATGWGLILTYLQQHSRPRAPTDLAPDSPSRS